LGKRTAFTIVVATAAKRELDAMRAFEQRQVRGAIDASLLFEPGSSTRKRKKLGVIEAGFEYDPPLWELKVGELRVFYSVDENERTVSIVAVRRKPPQMTTQEVVQ